MEKIIGNKKWLVLISVGFLVFTLFTSTIVYIVDPYFKYRVKDHCFFMNEWSVSPGLVKNYNYDTLIIGSSMTQNFNMDVFRREFNNKPLKIGIGGLAKSEMTELVDLANKVNKAKTYYLCMDLYNFTDNKKSRFENYLLRNNLLSHIRYSFSFGAWVKYIPMHILVSTAKKFGIKLPDKFDKKMSIDNLGNWYEAYKDAFGIDKVLKNYEAGAFSVSKVDTTDLLNKMKTNTDNFLAGLNFSKDKSVNFFFPPYSSLYWLNAQKEGYFETYLSIKKYFVEKANSMGYNVFDFQAEDFTMDLNNYKDTNHYSQPINEWMTVCFAKLKDKVTLDNISEFENKLRDNTEKFQVKLRNYLK